MNISGHCNASHQIYLMAFLSCVLQTQSPITLDCFDGSEFMAFSARL